MMKANKQIGFININEESIDKIIQNGDVVFERGFLREKTSTTLPINFGGVGKDLKDYRVYGNTVQNGEPTPNAPIEMVSCGDKTKNLLPLSIIPTQIINGLNITNDNGEIYISGSTTTVDIPVNITLKAGTYTNKNFNNTGFESNITLRDSNGTVIQTGTFVNLNSTTEKTFTLTEDKQISILRLYFQNGHTLTNYHLQVQLEQNDTISSYEPYGYKIPVNVRSENLFDISEITSVTNGTLSNNNITTNNSGNVAYFNVAPIFPQKKMLSGHTYYLSADIRIKSGTGIFSKMNDYVASWAQIQAPIISNEFQRYIYSKTYNGDTDCYRFLFQFGNTNNAVFEIKNIMLSEVNEDYQPYYNETTNIYLDEPLRKIDGYSDYIDFINGKVVRQLGEIVLNGSESWGIANGILYRTTTSSLIGSGINVCSTHFIGTSSQGSTANVRDNNPNNSICTASSGSARLYIKSSQFDSESSFKTWLQSNNVTVDYVLSTPTEESITLPNIPTIDGNNILNIETEITPSKVYIKYKSNE